MKHEPAMTGIASGAARVWTAGARLRAWLFQKGILRQRRLRARVISIGNISWGGTGKTPLCIWLAGRLQAAGLSPSILTRGYRRTSREPVKVLPPGFPPETAAGEGDEVQIFLRHLRIPMGISASRFEAGKLLEKDFAVDVHLLDDGFQHLSLARDLDLVLIDAANPWGGRRGWPILLREHLSSLRRADAILLTRFDLAQATEEGRSGLQDLKMKLQRLSPALPCFTVTTRLLHLTERVTGKTLGVQNFRKRKPLAFCALGTPQEFFGMLAKAGLECAGTKTFPDHHRYHLSNFAALERLAIENKADCFVTTEKDIVNFPAAGTLSLETYWAAIEPVMDDEEKFLCWIMDKLKLSPQEQAVSRAAVAAPR